MYLFYIVKFYVQSIIEIIYVGLQNFTDMIYNTRMGTASGPYGSESGLDLNCCGIWNSLTSTTLTTQQLHAGYEPIQRNVILPQVC